MVVSIAVPATAVIPLECARRRGGPEWLTNGETPPHRFAPGLRQGRTPPQPPRYVSELRVFLESPRHGDRRFLSSDAIAVQAAHCCGPEPIEREPRFPSR